MKITEYRKRMKTLSITSLAFSPDGTELLVNIGGEQLYLFDLFENKEANKPKFKFDFYKHLFKQVAFEQNSKTLKETKVNANETFQNDNSENNKNNTNNKK
jgi:hypothetical protein